MSHMVLSVDLDAHLIIQYLFLIKTLCKVEVKCEFFFSPWYCLCEQISQIFSETYHTLFQCMVKSQPSTRCFGLWFPMLPAMVIWIQDRNAVRMEGQRQAARLMALRKQRAGTARERERGRDYRQEYSLPGCLPLEPAQLWTAPQLCSNASKLACTRTAHLPKASTLDIEYTLWHFVSKTEKGSTVDVFLCKTNKHFWFIIQNYIRCRYDYYIYDHQKYLGSI